MMAYLFEAVADHRAGPLYGIRITRSFDVAKVAIEQFWSNPLGGWTVARPCSGYGWLLFVV